MAKFIIYFFVTNLSKSLRSLRAPEIQPIEMKNTPAEIFSEMTTGSYHRRERTLKGRKFNLQQLFNW